MSNFTSSSATLIFSLKINGLFPSLPPFSLFKVCACPLKAMLIQICSKPGLAQLSNLLITIQHTSKLLSFSLPQILCQQSNYAMLITMHNGVPQRRRLSGSGVS